MGDEVKRLVENEARCGYVTPPDNAEAFANAVAQVVDLSDEDREQMGIRGRSYHHSTLSRDVVYRRLDLILRSALNEK
jgi:glycosyltransferase involved in cell wall biosynthesis